MIFTQFIYPNGRKEQVSVKVSDELESKAQELIQNGYRFEVEKNPQSGLIYMDCIDTKVDHPVSSKFCDDGPEVLVKVAELVNDSYESFKSEPTEIDS